MSGLECEWPNPNPKLRSGRRNGSADCTRSMFLNSRFYFVQVPLDDRLLAPSDLNRLIMDYFVIEGYKSAAEEFSQEANLTPTMDFDSIESRMEIREAVQRGDVEEAIMRVNDLNPEVSAFDSCVQIIAILDRFMHRSQSSRTVMRLENIFIFPYRNFSSKLIT